MTSPIETARLVLRPFELDDAAAAFQWFGDPAVMKFIAGGPHASIEQTRQRLAVYREHHTVHGFAKWIVIEKATGQPIGDAGLMVLPDVAPAPDLGFRFAQACWGRGYATEAATRWIKAVFEQLRLDWLSAFAHVENHASRRVLEKVGFRFQTREHRMGMDAATYTLTMEEYAASNGG